MQIQAITGTIEAMEADAVVVSLFEGVEKLGGAAGAVDEALGGAIGALIAGGDFSGEMGEVAVLYPRGAIPTRRVLVVGLGPGAEFTADGVREAAAYAAKKARALNAERVASVLHGCGEAEIAPEAAAQALAEGTLLALYEYQKKRKAPADPKPPAALDVVLAGEDDLAAVEAGIRAGEAIAVSVALTRDLVNLPPNICTPAYMAEAATLAAAETGLRAQVLERGQMQALGMGALLSVAQGSDTPPRFIILEHNADRAEELDSLVLVGKGVTFDTGGYSLKSKTGMITMKVDMAGGAAVIGALRAVAALDVPLHVVGLVPASDNMINGHAYRPQEVITASNGVTIEIISTDAEGRMLLADALVFAKRYDPAAVVDIATLTGACVTALGRVAAGLFCTDDALQAKLLAASDAAAERVWPLPLFPEYDKTLESQTADIKNSGGAGSGVGSAAMFLKHFVDYPAWAHVDMAGMAADLNTKAYFPAGATGYGVRLLVEFVRGWAR